MSYEEGTRVEETVKVLVIEDDAEAVERTTGPLPTALA
jgi:hypothetical protein